MNSVNCVVRMVFFENEDLLSAVNYISRQPWFAINFQFGTFVAIRNPLVLQFVGNKAKRQISKRVFQESKANKKFRKTNISYPLIRTSTECLFFGNFGVLCFLETPVLRFTLLPYSQQIITTNNNQKRKKAMLKKEVKEQDVQEMKQSESGECFYFRHSVKPPFPLIRGRLQPVTVLKVTLLHGCCTNGTKWRKASHIEKSLLALFFHRPSTETLKASAEVLI